MFVRKKTTASGTVKHYLVENRREGGKVRQRVVCYLAEFPSVDEALAEIPKEIAYWQEDALNWRARVQTIPLHRQRRDPWCRMCLRVAGRSERFAARYAALLDRLRNAAGKP
jgi:hypothetical protein